ncbi:MAG: SDR family oxidoreductase [Acidimicrobiia bacterium]
MSGDGKRSVLVTGGSRGWGRAIVERFAPTSSTMFINYANDAGAAAEAAELARSAGADAHVIHGDMGSADDISAMFDQIEPRTDALDVVVHNAFHLTFADPMSATREQVLRAMDVGPLALMSIAQRAVPMLPPKTGRIIATSSVATIRLFHPTQGLGYFPMAAAKGALEVSVRYLATQLAPKEITVNAVAAAYIETPNLMAAPEEFRRAIERKTPYGRIPTALEMADAVHLLASPDAAITTGQVLVVDGGFTLV